MSTTPEAQLDDFIDRYAPEIATAARDILSRMRRRLPGALELVYDNYNALAIGFGPTEKPSEAVFSIALYPRWVTLFFLYGADLEDPHGLLQGAGNVVRHIVLTRPELLDDPEVQSLMEQALERAPRPFDPAVPNRVVIKSVSAKQRPRRPVSVAR